MLFKRVLVTDQAGLPQVSRQGLGMLGNIQPTESTVNADHTLALSAIAGGCVWYSALSAGRTVTTPSAADIIAACPDMDIGDTFCFWVSIQDAFALTWDAGAGVALLGKATTPASGSSLIVVQKSASNAVIWHVL